MSSQTYAIQAVNLLRAAGHQNAHHADRHEGVREHIISVNADTPGVAFEALRLVRHVDPDAEQVR